jgi:hypothetical protein
MLFFFTGSSNAIVQVFFFWKWIVLDCWLSSYHAIVMLKKIIIKAMVKWSESEKIVGDGVRKI